MKLRPNSIYKIYEHGHMRGRVRFIGVLDNSNNFVFTDEEIQGRCVCISPEMAEDHYTLVYDLYNSVKERRRGTNYRGRAASKQDVRL